MGRRLQNPPVYCTLVQVRFNALLKLGEYLADVQERFRKAGFPAFTQGQSVVVRLAWQDDEPAQQPMARPQYVFGNSQRTHAFVLTSDSLALQSTDYGTFELFSSTFLKGLASMHEAVELNLTERIGLRYLDHVVPRAGDALEAYLVPEVLGMGRYLDKLGTLHGQAKYSYSETLGLFGHIQLRSRVLVRDGVAGLPPDLSPLDLVIPNRFTESPGRHAILDTDGFIEARQDFALENIERELQATHDVISAAFKATVSKHALSVWDARP